MTTSANDSLPMSAVLMSISKHVAVRCRAENKAFMDCRNLDKNPEKCLAQGTEVTKCVIQLMRDLDSKCSKQLKDFHECMDYFSHNFQKCRKEQKAFEELCPINLEK